MSQRLINTSLGVKFLLAKIKNTPWPVEEQTESFSLDSDASQIWPLISMQSAR